MLSRLSELSLYFSEKLTINTLFFMKLNLLIFLLISLPIIAQKTDTTNKEPVNSMPSVAFGGSARDLSKLLAPNVASFEKVSHVPVNYNTGQLQYTLPFFEIPIDDNLNIPIVLSHSNSGLKPADVPSWVGNGWNLNVGGAITQYIKGIDDLGIDGLKSNTPRNKLEQFYNLTNPMTPLQKLQYQIDISDQVYDSQFDIFSFNILGRTGQFYFDRDSIKFLNHENLLIQYAGGLFEVTDELGYKFSFGIKSRSTGTYDDPMISRTGFKESASTWYLTRITTPNNQQIDFSYASDIAYWVREIDHTFSNGYRLIPGPPVPYCQIKSSYDEQSSTNRRNYHQYLLTSINYPAGKVEFQLADRNDLSNSSGNKSKLLNILRVRNLNTSVIKKVFFNYGYLGGATSNDRLQLNSVNISGADTTAVQTYGFDYFPSVVPVPVPGLESATGINAQNHGVDYWGYRNGKPNTNKVPRYNYYDINTFQSPSEYVGGADRHAVALSSQAGMLKKITYPDKGYDEFEYEGNKADYSNSVTNDKYIRDSKETAYISQFLSKTAGCKTGTITQEFSISEPLSMARVNVNMIGNGSTGNLQIKRLSDNAILLNLSQPVAEEWEQAFTTDLSAGNYQYVLTIACPNEESYGAGRFEITKQSTTHTWVRVGGNRIKKIKSYATTGKPVIRLFQYADSELSSPMVLNYNKQASIPQVNLEYCKPCGNKFVVGTNSIFSYEGFHVEYLEVSELVNLESKNTNAFVRWPSVGYAYPSPSNVVKHYFPWRAGLSKRTAVERINGNVFSAVKETFSSYTPDTDIQFSELKDLKVTQKYPCMDPLLTYPLTHNNPYFDGYDFRYYDRFGKTREILNFNSDLGGTIIADTTTYFYNSRWQPYRVKKSRRDGSYNEQTTFYAEDFNNTAEVSIALLKEKHIIGKPVKIINTINNITVSGDLARYDGNGNMAGLYKYESAANHIHNPGVFFTADFMLEETRVYNSKGRITGFTGRDGVSYVYLWSYNFTHPVALIANATLTEVSGIAGSIEAYGLLTAEAAITAGINALKGGLPNAQFTTAIYVPGIGIKQLTEPDGMLYTYEYDGRNRLKTVKDRNGKVVDSYTYQNALVLSGE